jgi:hypothetical protein
MNSERLLERETQFEPLCGLGGLNPNQSENTLPSPCEKARKPQETSQK